MFGELEADGETLDSRNEAGEFLDRDEVFFARGPFERVEDGEAVGACDDAEEEG